MTSPLHPAVRAGWCAFNEPFEARVPWMYCDVLGLVTVGVGCLVDPVGAALVLPFVFPDGTPASRADIEGAWRATKRMPAGLEYHHYRDENGYGLTLSDATIEELALRLSPPGPEEQRIEGVHLDGASPEMVRKVLAGLLEEMAAEQPKPATSGHEAAPDGGPHDMLVGPCACGATHEAPKPAPADHFASPTERTT